ncbi:hypothetical protein BAE44_0000608 [Dichanthelium oligosanthes]|uniref:Phytocyanin domain-containing protein n=1 Tax=Dichanthelium oligosanthes TaxID=888268 RepID=A0A1E5WLX3_9POAL|nr:hypothetical protein BAE44_0000608 [Dichanthelium oligosanthes]
MASLRFVVFAASCAFLAASAASLPPAVFNVGDERGWAVPPAGNDTETYNHWAKRNRFQVGDILSFKYANDSVLLVSHDDYKQCSTETPVSRFTGGDTKFRLDGYGPFYFVSGVPGHCEAGQRMIARVRAPSSLTAGVPASAPGMPPTLAPTPAAASSPAVPSVGSGSASASTPSPSPSPQPSGASRRALSVVSSAVGLVVLGVISFFVVV